MCIQRWIFPFSVLWLRIPLRDFLLEEIAGLLSLPSVVSLNGQNAVYGLSDDLCNQDVNQNELMVLVGEVCSSTTSL